MTAPDLNASFAACRDITRARARNFYWGLRLTPEPKRSAVYAVYAWMRHADDITDDTDADPTAADPLAALDRLRQRTDDAFLTASTTAPPPQDPDRPTRPAFIHTIRDHRLVPDDFHAVIDALETDATFDARRHPTPTPIFDTMDQLETYCRGVASAVGIICLRIWGTRPWSSLDRARPLAVRKGLAFQLTNILRDIATDAHSNRCYIPQDILAAHDLSPDALAHWRDPKRCTALVTELAAEARAHYAAAEPLNRLVHPDGAPTLAAMTRIYAAVLARIERAPAAAATPGAARLSATRKATIAATAAARALVGLKP